MTPDMIVTTDLEGQKVAGERNPSSDLLITRPGIRIGLT